MEKTRIKIGLISLGCPKNLADLEALCSTMQNIHITPVKQAKIVLLNTCGFLKKARAEVYENINKLKNKKVVLLGCLAGKLTKEIFKKYPQVRGVVSSAHYLNINSVLKYINKNVRIFAVSKEPAMFENPAGKMLLSSAGYAYIKIAEGCNNKCAYCLIPSLKGQYRSRDMDDILAEAKYLINLGIKELILVAQDCGCYGVDLYKEKKLHELLKKLDKIKGKFWIRILYIYPETIDEKLLKTIASSKKILRYLDVPLQHGDPNVLKKMNRPADTKKTLEKINLIKKTLPGVTLRTSLIVGFPGESTKAFERLKSFVEKINFDHVGVFEYSREKGTPSYSLKPQISGLIKRKRRKEVMLLQQKISFANNKKLIGKKFEALIENYNPDKKIYIGRIGRFAPEIDGLVYVKSKKKLNINEFVKIKITKVSPYDLQGDILQ
ncbi:30S ribosomal protein S12 methylthiotransferase RimO [Candidatus Peregrinibacteria bacterium]|nr:30S ribosomal protein S12 methylthiotransferase RimO [Candidatus Peregrinibacteria bacterium]